MAILKNIRKYKNLFIIIFSVNFLECKLKNEQSDSENVEEKRYKKQEVNRRKAGESYKTKKNKDISASKIQNLSKKNKIKYNVKSGGSEKDIDDDEDKKESTYQESEDEPILDNDNENNEKDEIYNDEEEEKLPNDLGNQLEEEDTDSSDVKVSVRYEDPGIILPKEKRGLKVQRVYLSHPHGAHFLPHEYKTHGPRFEEDKKWLQESQRASIIENLKTVQAMGLANPNEAKNKGLSAIRFKVKYLDVKDMKTPNNVWHLIPERNRRKLATRALFAYNKRKGIKQNPFKSMALVSFLRPRTGWENPFRKLIYALWFVFIQRGNDPKKMILSVNNLSDENYKKYLNKLNKTVITPENTELDLLEVFVPRRSDEKDHDSMEFSHRMGILDESTLLCYNAEFKDPSTGKIRQKNDKVYFREIAKFKWLGPLNNLSEEDYELNGKRYSWKRKIKAKVAKKLSRKYMLFASEESYDIAHEPFKGLKTNRNGKILGEFRVIYRLTIGGICVGVINAAANYVDLGTQDWGRKKAKPNRLATGTGKMLRGIARFSDKHELGWYNCFE